MMKSLAEPSLCTFYKIVFEISTRKGTHIKPTSQGSVLGFLFSHSMFVVNRGRYLFPIYAWVEQLSTRCK